MFPTSTPTATPSPGCDIQTSRSRSAPTTAGHCDEEGYAEGDQFWNTGKLRSVRAHEGRARGERRPAAFHRRALPES